MFSNEERFHFTLCEMMYMDEELTTDEEQKCIENAITILEKHLKEGSYVLIEDEMRIIEKATLIMEALE